MRRAITFYLTWIVWETPAHPLSWRLALLFSLSTGAAGWPLTLWAKGVGSTATVANVSSWVFGARCHPRLVDGEVVRDVCAVSRLGPFGIQAIGKELGHMAGVICGFPIPKAQCECARAGVAALASFGGGLKWDCGGRSCPHTEQTVLLLEGSRQWPVRAQA